MNRIWEILFGLKRGFLDQSGELSVQFNPQWPGQATIGASMWNLLMAVLGIALVIYVYRRESRSRNARILLGSIRLLLLAMVLVLLNRPVVTMTESRTDVSVLAVLVDDSISMRVRDISPGNNQAPIARLDAAIGLLSPSDQSLMQRLQKDHQVRVYRFDRDAQPVGTSTDADYITQLAAIKPTGQSTQVTPSIVSVLNDLQGQRLAGVVLLTDGRDTPARSVAEAMKAIKSFGTKVYSVALGGEKAPVNLDLQSVTMQDAAFTSDIVNVKAVIRGTGFAANHPTKLTLKNKATGVVLVGPDGKPAEVTVNLADDKATTAEVQFVAGTPGQVDLIAELTKEPGEIDEDDNVRTAQLAVLDAKIAVLYIDGYPRWEYRYIKNQMIRDKTIDISCLLTSADSSFSQEGDRPVTRFPETMEELMEYDVVLLGDVDPRWFTDRQLQLISEFVSKRGGGFGMVAGPRHSPSQYKNTAVEPILPVSISRSEPDDNVSITQGFRPVVTRPGQESSVFRFFADRTRNEKYLREEIQPIFWYARGVTVKRGVGEVYAEHPTESSPDGWKAPILVMGRFGAGRTLFSAIDDSWRWRFYTGESIFDTYWVQQFRHLARSKKLGQRRVAFTTLRPSYELGEQVQISLRIIDSQLLGQLPDQLRVEMKDEQGQPLRTETLYRQEGSPDNYAASFTADKVGRFNLILPAIAGGVDMMNIPLDVVLPKLELTQPQVDRAGLQRLASETQGAVVEYADASKLPGLIQSAARVVPIYSTQPLWNAPLAMVLFVLLITTEWIVRKLFGMV